MITVTAREIYIKSYLTNIHPSVRPKAFIINMRHTEYIFVSDHRSSTSGTRFAHTELYRLRPGFSLSVVYM